MRRLIASVTLVASALVSVTVAGDARAATDPDVIPGAYIVVVRDSSSPSVVAWEHARDRGARVSHIYEDAMNGYAATMSESAATRVARDRRVLAVEHDRVVRTTAQTIPTGLERIGGKVSSTASGNGSGSVNVDVAVLDTGIDIDHPDLDVVGGKMCVSGSSYDDGNGHGTHVAGTIAAKDDANGVVGVAPGARLWAVRVLGSNGSGSWSSIICGIDWVTANASTIEVANMSLGGSSSETASSCGSSTLHRAICNSVGAGVTYAVSAGNSAADASGFVPAKYSEVITVSALADFNGLPGGGAPETCRSDVDDTFANFSNYGTGVDLIAPGVCILSTWKGGGYNTISGTSMASPHVAGAAALHKAANPGASPADVQTALRNAGNLDWNNGDDGDSAKEPLLNVGTGTSGGGTPPTENVAPTASFTESCPELTCSFTDTSTDTDGTIAEWSWDFGDGSTSTATNPYRTYAAAGDYTVVLTVTDDDGATNFTSTAITVSAAPSASISLSVTGYKVKGVQAADLTWSGATSTNVDIFRDNVKIVTINNDGAYTDNLNRKGGGSSTYRVCEAGTITCSNNVTVSF